MSRPTYRHTIHALQGDKSSLIKAARTTSLSFDGDNLIRWLRPNGPSWGKLDAATNKWQYRRFQNDIWNAKIVHASSVPGNVAASSSSPNGKANELLKETATTSYGSIINKGSKMNKDGYTIISIEEDIELAANEDEEFSGVGILFPPKEDQPPVYSCKGLSRWALGYWHGFLNWISPANDEAADMSRVIMMMTEHDAKVEKYGLQFAAVNRRLWYLEVCCVRPSMQGKGTARAIMEWVLKQVGDDACYLECTDEANVAFYNKFGFELYETVRLTHRGDDLRLFMMIRQ